MVNHQSRDVDARDESRDRKVGRKIGLKQIEPPALVRQDIDPAELQPERPNGPNRQLRHRGRRERGEILGRTARSCPEVIRIHVVSICRDRSVTDHDETPVHSIVDVGAQVGSMVLGEQQIDQREQGWQRVDAQRAYAAMPSADLNDGRQTSNRCDRCAEDVTFRRHHWD